jgi:hypothetical protein
LRQFEAAEAEQQSLKIRKNTEMNLLECKMYGKIPFSIAQVYDRRDILCPTLSEIERFRQMIRIGVSVIDRTGFLSIPLSVPRSTTRDSAVQVITNCDLTITTTIPFPRVRSLLEAMPRREFTFVINRKAFPSSFLEAIVLSPAVREQL